MGGINGRSAVILLAEDDPGDQELTRRALKRGKVRNDLHVVQDGEEALDYLFQRGQYADTALSPWPDMLLLDLNMPKMGGLAVLEKLREHPNFSQVVVVVLTTSNHDKDIQKSYELGAKSYICKPVDFEKFIQIIHHLEEYWFQLVVLPANV